MMIKVLTKLATKKHEKSNLATASVIGHFDAFFYYIVSSIVFRYLDNTYSTITIGKYYK